MCSRRSEAVVSGLLAVTNMLTPRPDRAWKTRRDFPGPEERGLEWQGHAGTHRSKEGSDMLVLSRKLGEKIYINENICITVVDIDRGKIRLGIEAPRNVPIFRQELVSDAPAVKPEPVAVAAKG